MFFHFGLFTHLVISQISEQSSLLDMLALPPAMRIASPARSDYQVNTSFNKSFVCYSSYHPKTRTILLLLNSSPPSHEGPKGSAPGTLYLPCIGLSPVTIT